MPAGAEDDHLNRREDGEDTESQRPAQRAQARAHSGRKIGGWIPAAIKSHGERSGSEHPQAKGPEGNYHENRRDQTSQGRGWQGLRPLDRNCWRSTGVGVSLGEHYF